MLDLNHRRCVRIGKPLQSQVGMDVQGNAFFMNIFLIILVDKLAIDINSQDSISLKLKYSITLESENLQCRFPKPSPTPSSLAR